MSFRSGGVDAGVVRDAAGGHSCDLVAIAIVFSDRVSRSIDSGEFSDNEVADEVDIEPFLSDVHFTFTSGGFFTRSVQFSVPEGFVDSVVGDSIMGVD